MFRFYLKNEQLMAGANYLTLFPCYLNPFIIKVSEALLDVSPKLLMKLMPAS